MVGYYSAMGLKMKVEESEMMVQKITSLREHKQDYPTRLLIALAEVAKLFKKDFFLVGGTLRDWLLQLRPNDLDFTVDCDAVRCCRALIRELAGGTFVPLGTAKEDAGRVVWQGLTIDFSSFREGTDCIEKDLRLRDFTINSMGLSFLDFLDESRELVLIDPLNGQKDLASGLLRNCPDAFVSDPLRMLRGYRLFAKFGFQLDDSTLLEIEKHKTLLTRVSVERVSYEMDLIMESQRSFAVLTAMAKSKILFEVLPELALGLGLQQPKSHHLDVFGHSLSAVKHMEKIIENPGYYYPENGEVLADYLQHPANRSILKWAALLHDLGKPATRDILEDKGGRITFYNHDHVGRELVQQAGRRLCWSNTKRERIAALVGMHMHPFHLCNVSRKQKVSKKACLKLVKRAGGELMGLFLLSMADSLAGKGEAKPAAMEEELAALFSLVIQVYNRDIKPTLAGPALLSGNDLISLFALPPGPIFSRILSRLEEAQVEKEVNNREEALVWVEQLLATNGFEHIS